MESVRAIVVGSAHGQRYVRTKWGHGRELETFFHQYEKWMMHLLWERFAKQEYVCCPTWWVITCDLSFICIICICWSFRELIERHLHTHTKIETYLFYLLRTTQSGSKIVCRILRLKEGICWSQSIDDLIGSGLGISLRRIEADTTRVTWGQSYPFKDNDNDKDKNRQIFKNKRIQGFQVCYSSL